MSADEESFLDALRANSGDDDTRQVYADWLEEKGDPRAEYLRLEMAVVRDGWRSADRQRLVELGRQLDPAWVKTVRRSAPRDVNERASLPLSGGTSPTDVVRRLPTGGMDAWRNLDARAPTTSARSWWKSTVLGIILAVVVIEVVDFARDPKAWLSRFVQREYERIPGPP